MIQSFRSRDTQRLANDQDVRRFRAIERVARRKLEILASTTRLDDLRIPPGNRLEALKVSRAGQHSVRINDQWRICFAGPTDMLLMWRSLITIESIGLKETTMNSRLPLISPGEILLEEFLKPMNLSQNQLARGIAVPTGRINDIIRGKRGITRDTAARLAVYFGTTPDLWINLQARFDAKIAIRDLMPKLVGRIQPQVKPAA